MTIKNLYPKARPNIIYNVINGRPELPAASTFSRASEATYVDSDGLIKTAPAGEPRFNYDPDTGEFLGLMLDDSYTNLLNSDFGNMQSFSSNNAVAQVTMNYAVAPDETQTAALVTVAAGTGSGGSSSPLYRNGLNVGTKGNISMFLKFPDNTSTKKEIVISLYNILATALSEAKFSINSMTTSTTNLFESAVIQPWSNGWYRLSCSYTNNNSDKIATISFRPPFESKADPSDPSGPTSNFLYWGAQLTVDGTNGSQLKPIQINTGGTFTQAPDAFSLTSSSNFDGGFSLLLDSETTTDDYFYKIKASGTTIAELNNANGTLDWVVNGVSAATSGE